MSRLTSEDFAAIYARFEAPVSRFDCGRKCAPLNDGEPVCCSTKNAVPVADRAEYNLLKSRTDLWGRFKPYDAATRKIVDELARSVCAIECKGARFCERQNRTVACRAFPFFPYLTRQREFIGLSYYWDFEDRCWMISHMKLVEQAYVEEFVAAFEAIFAKDRREFDTYVDFSATMRRVFSRRKRKIPLIARDGGYRLIDPSTGIAKPCGPEKLPRLGPFTSETAYRRAVKEAGGVLPAEGLAPA